MQKRRVFLGKGGSGSGRNRRLVRGRGSGVGGKGELGKVSGKSREWGKVRIGFWGKGGIGVKMRIWFCANGGIWA